MSPSVDECPSPPPKRRFCWYHWLGLSFLSAVLFLVGLYEYQRYQIRVIYREMRQEGRPTNYSELKELENRNRQPNDTSSIWNPVIEDTLAAMNAVREPGTPAPFVTNDRPAFGKPWDGQEKAEQYLKNLSPQLEAIHRAADAGGQANIAGIKTSDPRTIARLLELEAVVASRRGDHARQRRAIRSILRIANLNRGQPRLLQLLVAGAIRQLAESELLELLAQHQSNNEELAVLQQLLVEVDFHAEMTSVEHGEVVAMVEFVREDSRVPFHQTNELEVLQYHRQVQSALSLPWPELLARVKQIDLEANSRRFHSWIDSMRYTSCTFQSVFGHFSQSIANASARQATINAVLAAERHRLRHGQFPDSLQAIDRDLFGTLPDGTIPLADPFDGQPLRYRREGKGLRVYSVGMNGQDDNGDFSSKSGEGLLDIGFSLTQDSAQVPGQN